MTILHFAIRHFYDFIMGLAVKQGALAYYVPRFVNDKS